VEEVVAILARNLEADIAEVLSMDYWLLTFAANDPSLEFHNAPLKLVHYSYQDSLFHDLSRS
jgi:hypothetical protein